MLRKFAGHPLTTWPTGREATTPEDIAERDALRERYLTPEAMTISECQLKLTEQARGASVPTQQSIPIVLYPGESEAEDDNTFTRWDHRARRLPSMNAFKASASKAGVRLECKLRYEFVAEGQMPATFPVSQLVCKTTCWSNHRCFDCADVRGSLGIDERAVHPHTYWWEVRWDAS